MRIIVFKLDQSMRQAKTGHRTNMLDCYGPAMQDIATRWHMTPRYEEGLRQSYGHIRESL